MRKLFIVELKHCLGHVEYKIIFVALLAANMLSYIFCINNDAGKSYQFVRSANENFILQGTEAAYIPYILVSFLPVFSIIIWSLSKRKEEQDNSAILLIQRVGVKKYLYCKTLVIILSAFCVNIVPLLLNLCFCHFTYPMKGFDSAWAEPNYLIGIFSYNADNFADMIRLQNPILYNMIYIFNFGIFGAGLALLGFAISFFDKMEHYYYVKIPASIFIFYTAQNIVFTVVGLGKYTIQNYVTPNSAGNVGSYILVLIVLYAIDFILIHKGIRNYEVL